MYRTLARKIAINTTVFMMVIQLIGTAMLRFFGVSLPVMQVSGGLVLAAMGWGLLNEDAPQAKAQPAATESSDVRLLEQKVFYPFTFPLTAGPGSIVVMVTLSAHASVGGVLSAAEAHAGIVAAVMLLSAAVYICYGRAPTITARVRPETAHGILRVIAFVLLSIGVQITWNGLDTLLKAR